MGKIYGIWIVSVTILVLSFVGTASAANWTVDGSGGADFTEIQEAINNASVGDTIIVHSGVYYENVVVYKSVTLMGIGQPVVEACGNADAIKLSADGITLVGFTATNSDSYRKAGIMITSNNNTITGNNASNNGYGIYLCLARKISGNGTTRYYSSNNNTITGNNASNNGYGIYLYGSSNNNTITGNNVSNNNDGISLYGSSNNNTITGNNASSNSYGICLWYSSNNNTITGNNANSNHLGIHLYDSSNNTIAGNNVSNNNEEGIGLCYSCNNNTITGNNASNNNWYGIDLKYRSNNNSISSNTICNNNVYGIHLYYSSNNNTIYLNDFINNSDNAYSEESTNTWNTPEEITYTYNGSTYKSYLGNYWGDYKEKYPDAEEIDSRGIWDTPYSIDEDEDSYPLMQQWGNYHP